MEVASKYLVVAAALALLTAGLMGCKSNRPMQTGETSKRDSLRTFSDLMANPVYPAGLTRAEYEGKLTYTQYCQVCHGADGDGKGFNAFNLESSFNVRPFNFSDSAGFAKLSEEDLVKVITEGGKSRGLSQYMPPWGAVIGDGGVQNVIAYIKVFSKKKSEP
jgi:mono/diheme cytochrome c family protein